MLKSRVSRRKALQIGAAATALPLVHVRTAHAAGKVSVFFWDHWVPAGNVVIKEQCAAWGKKNKVDVQIDFITSMGNKNLLTINAEAQAQTGHDAITIPNWEVQNQRDHLEPMDDVVGRLEAKYGKVNAVGYYLGRDKGKWLALPTSWGTQNKGPCGRISLLKEHAGMDIQKMFPVKDVETPEAKAWTFDKFLSAAESCHKAGYTFGIGLGQTSDSVDTAGGIFAAFGAQLVNEKGDITINSPEVKQCLEWAQKFVKALPANAVSYDDASNNRALISGKSAMIWNPPSAWAVARRDAPKVAADCWTFPAPLGPKGRFMPHSMNFWGVWKFSKNKTATKELLEYLMQAENAEPRDNAVLGYDLPPFANMTNFKIWETAGPPTGSVYNYPIRSSIKEETNIAAMPAPPDIAVQIYNRGTMSTMFAKLQTGQSIDQVIKWASNELEGFVR